MAPVLCTFHIYNMILRFTSRTCLAHYAYQIAKVDLDHRSDERERATPKCTVSMNSSFLLKYHSPSGLPYVSALASAKMIQVWDDPRKPESISLQQGNC